MSPQVRVGTRGPPALGDALDFLRLLWALDQELEATSRGMERRIGVRGPQRLAVRLIGRFPGLPAGHLAELLHVHPSTVSGLLAKLQHQGLITRQPDPRDRRRVRLGLTERGRALDVQAGETIEATVAALLEQMKPDEIAVAREMLERLTERLQALNSFDQHTRSIAPRSI
jgi:MarR family transcriptional regulator, organic hydroperoxide resistance regulator